MFFFNPLLAQNLQEKKGLAKLVWSRGMPGGFACNFDTFQVGFHAEHLFLQFSIWKYKGNNNYYHHQNHGFFALKYCQFCILW